MLDIGRISQSRIICLSLLCLSFRSPYENPEGSLHLFLFMFRRKFEGRTRADETKVADGTVQRSAGQVRAPEATYSCTIVSPYSFGGRGSKRIIITCIECDGKRYVF